MGSKTIFGAKTPAVKPKNEHRERTQKRERKKRSDAKNDIKFRVSEKDYKYLRFKAFEHRISVTAFCSMIVKEELGKKNECESFEYEQFGHFVHVVLEDDYFNMVQVLAVEWDLSLRKTAYRLLRNYLHRTTGGIRIINYKER